VHSKKNWMKKSQNMLVWIIRIAHFAVAGKGRMIWLLLSVSGPSKRFAISSPPPFCCPRFSFVGGVAKK
jgi:hypothetical protein